MAAPTNELGQFMAAIRDVESSGNYRAIGQDTGSKYGVARGAYQIMSGLWDSYSSSAGYGGANWWDPRVQDAVAAYHFNRLYDKYGGDWRLVAAAWFGGEGAANKAQRAGGIYALAGIDDGFIDIPEYVSRVTRRMPAYASQHDTSGMPSGRYTPPGYTPQDIMAMSEEEQQALGVRSPEYAQAAEYPEPVMEPARALAQRLIEETSSLIAANPDDEEYVAHLNSVLERLYATEGAEDERAADAQWPTAPTPEVR